MDSAPAPASTGLLIAVVIALSIVAYGPNGIGDGDNGTGSNGTGDGPSLNGAVPIATIPEAEYTNDVQCTVEPMTRDELVAQLKEANQATRPALPRYERSIEPTSKDLRCGDHTDLPGSCGLAETSHDRCASRRHGTVLNSRCFCHRER